MQNNPAKIVIQIVNQCAMNRFILDEACRSGIQKVGNEMFELD